MNSEWKSSRLRILTCVVALLAITGCGEPETNESAENQEVSPGEENGDGGETDGDSNASDGDDNGDGDSNAGDGEADGDGGDGDGDSEEGCDLTGFSAPGDLLLKETSFGWSLIAESGPQVLSLSLASDGGAQGTGSFEFEDLELTDQSNSLLIADSCTAFGCDNLFQAIGGTLEILIWDRTSGGAFEVEFQGLELVEVVQTEAGLQRVQEGLVWCISTLEMSAASLPLDTFPADRVCETDQFLATEEGLSALGINGDTLIVEALSSQSTPHDVLSLQLYGDASGIETGIYEIDDFNYATCEYCLLIYAGCDGLICEKTFIAGQGDLEITSAGTADNGFTAGAQFTATLSSAKLVEVIINPNTYETRLVEDGEVRCIGEFSWDIEVTENE